MKKRLQALWRSRAALPCACYLLAAVSWVLWGVFCRLDDLGLAPQRAVPVQDFELVDLAPAGMPGGYTATSGDPQMILSGLSGQKLRTVSYLPQFPDADPREMCLYYTSRPDEPFSQDKRVFPRTAADGRYVYTLPHGPIAALRLDPCSPGVGAQVTVVFALDEIVFNHTATLPRALDGFLPDAWQLFWLLLCPALAAAALDWLRAALALWRRRPRSPAAP